MREDRKDSDKLPDAVSERLAQRLRALRQAQGWSLDELAGRSGISRATLSRIETQEVSPTASLLARLCAAHGMPMSRLLRMVEGQAPALVTRGEQAVWTDPEHAFTRRSVSPPADALRAEVIECTLAADTRIHYDSPPRAGLEHHLVLTEGALSLTVDGVCHRLGVGDCLRYVLNGSSTFETPPAQGARYFLVLV